MNYHQVPEISYGVLQRDQFSNENQEVCEEIRRLGYAVLDSGMDSSELAGISNDFNSVHEQYVKHWGHDRLIALNEHNTIRAPLLNKSVFFQRLPFKPRLLSVLSEIIPGKFILNQQNAIINPAQEIYNQSAWHRDLPYQHFVSNTPLAINALFCVDDFTPDNGATYVLPGSHKTSNFPTDSYIKRHAVQILAKAGQYILLDCMTFHRGGFNSTGAARRAVNHVYTIPFFKQQIHLPRNIDAAAFSLEELEIIGCRFQEPGTVEDYLLSRMPAS
ncbi:phytanoyl-CoA dioxygenase family protein [Rhodoferax aquaticus]|uniref:Phytanoyl-CoA dioxygenase n=1 Tax=Rhodoferax aquaticus TaxID=2527691 RepID=A0A515EP65_9BURK|nr:phytanoyl-CoA dioxygenase family protein [Rhodoferax aquaticus]QDL54439.1 phytanoyl-CoA dioxygenase [Rhodoferax aquaticus]